MSIAFKEIKRKILKEGACLSLPARSFIWACYTERPLLRELKSLNQTYGSLYNSDEENPLKIFLKWKEERNRIEQNRKLDLRTDSIPDDCGLQYSPEFYPKFKNVHYAYIKGFDQWFIYEDFYFGHLMIFEADRFRVDECLQMYLKLHKL